MFSVKFNLFTLIVLIKFIPIANCGYLFSRPMKTPKANIHIEATLTDKEGLNRKWSISEHMAGTSKSHGKIHVTGESQSFYVFYDHSVDDKRLIISDYECYQMSKDQDLWSTSIPGIRQSLLSLILLTGPSFIYRLSDKSLKWNTIDENMNGTSISTMTTILDESLNIKVYFKSGVNKEIENAFRIDFDGYYNMPNTSFIYRISESLVLNILSITQIDENLDVKVQPITGIGCPDYFQLEREFPKLTTRQLHFTFTETLTSDLNSSKTILNVEVYIDGDKKLTRIGVDDDYTISDFNLAVSYYFKLSKCQIKSFDSYMPGLIGGQLDINELTWMNGQFKYVGKTIYEPRARGIFDTWESVEYGRKIEGTKYDKVVTTQYMAILSNPNDYESTSIDYVPVAMVRTAYKKDNMGKYFVAESRRRDISEFQRAITKAQYQNLFSISDCFVREQRVILNFEIRSEENGYTCSVGTQFAEDHFYEFKESFKNVLTKQISPLRIGSIYLDFHIDRISARVEFFERPPLEKSFQIRDAKVKVDNPKLTSGGIIAKSIDECLKTQLKENYFKEILYCPSLNGLCLNIEDPNSLEETVDSNIDCKLYYFPLMNQYRLTKEIELADIHKSSLRLDNMPISLKCDNCTTASKSHRYRITNVLDYTFFDQISHKQSSFMEIQKSSKLISTDKSVHPVSGAIHSIGDCYRTCVTPNNFDCVAFSYCSNGNSHECLISSALFIPNATVYANNCSTYSRNFLLEYQKNPNQQFYDISDDDSVYSWTVEDCAAQCSQSPKCFSFQYCSNNNQCTFTKTSYPVKKVRHDIFCNVYTPKKSQEFVSTGTTLVSEFILSESKLNMEQCAALCYNWRAGNESCKSFNFCPKGRLETTCQLTQYMVGNPNVATSPSQNCYNFQLLKKLQQRESNHEAFAPNDDMANAATSISLAFLVVGLALGIATTSIYHMIHNRHKYRVTTVHQEQDLDS